LAPAGCDPLTAALLLACDEFPDAGCDPVFTAGDPFPAVADVGEGEVLACGAGDPFPAAAVVGEGEVLACGAGDFPGVAAAVPDFWPAAGVDVGLGFACWPELDPAPVFCAAAVAARAIASAIT